eukprot:9326938-Heterocapsa_arctica.AAC.1
MVLVFSLPLPGPLLPVCVRCVVLVFSLLRSDTMSQSAYPMQGRCIRPKGEWATHRVPSTTSCHRPASASSPERWGWLA